MAIADAQLAFPFLLLAIAIAAALGSSLTNVIIILTISSWVVFARLVRGSVLSLREREFVIAAQSIGASNMRIVCRHILPHVLSIVLAIAAVTVGRLIVLEAGLSFLGLGVQPPTPTWGGILSDGRNYLQNAPWIATVPGVVITALVLAMNFLGDWLRDGLDPRLRIMASRERQVL
jgi:peptide/nickel transport system permease protein